MTTFEIILFIIGIALFVGSFFIPEVTKANMNEVRDITKREIRDMISLELIQIKDQIDEAVDEKVGSVCEETKTAIEQLSDEKMKGMEEYSANVLGEMEKNHQDTLFLYEMLDSKRMDLETSSMELDKKIQTAGDVSKEVESIVWAVKQIDPAKESDSAEASKGEEAENDNDRILKLHRQGMSNSDIAKELGMEVLDVKLVIGLYEGTKNEA